jgi:hypothetical protein
MLVDVTWLSRETCDAQRERKFQTDNVSVSFVKLLRKEGIHRSDLTFDSLPTTFSTVAPAAGDAEAVYCDLGNSDDNRSGLCRQAVNYRRIEKVSTEYTAGCIQGGAA